MWVYVAINLSFALTSLVEGVYDLWDQLSLERECNNHLLHSKVSHM